MIDMICFIELGCFPVIVSHNYNSMDTFDSNEKKSNPNQDQINKFIG